MKKIIIMLSVLFGIPYLSAQDYQYLEYQNEQIMQTEKYMRGNDYQKDFLLFMELLQTTHPAFALDPQYHFDVDLITKKGYQHLESCNSLFDFKLFLSSQIAPLHDGHTFVGFFQEDDYKLVYPIKIWVEEHIPYVQAIEKEHRSVLEKQIVSINGFSITDIYSKFSDVIIAENVFFFEKQLFEFILFPNIWNHIYPMRKDSLLKLDFNDRTSLYLKPKNRTDIKDVVFIEKKNKQSETQYNREVPFFYTFMEKEGFAYLQFNECVDQNSIRQYYDNLGYTDENGNFSSDIEEQIQQYQKFDTLLLSLFSTIKLKNISTLVIDVRNNSGGNSELCRQLLSYLTNIDNHKTSNTLIRISDFFTQYYPQLYDFLYQHSLKKLELGQLYSNDDFSEEDEDIEDKYFKMNNDTSLVFNGTTIFIQGKNTYSSAGDLLIEAKDNQIGIIIGENSRFRPCNFGDILFWKLPNTETIGGISHKYFTRPDESKCNEEYLIPDVYIPTTLEDYKNGIDPCWEWIKKNY